MAKRTKGKCKYCGKEYTFSYMNKHLPACEARQKKWMEELGGKNCGYFELAICPKYNRDYWLFVEIAERSLLCTCARNAIVRAVDFCAKIVRKLMSVEKRCF